MQTFVQLASARTAFDCNRTPALFFAQSNHVIIIIETEEITMPQKELVGFSPTNIAAPEENTKPMTNKYKQYTLICNPLFSNLLLPLAGLYQSRNVIIISPTPEIISAKLSAPKPTKARASS